MPTWIEIGDGADHWATVAAVAVGAIWTFYVFVFKRTRDNEARAEAAARRTEQLRWRKARQAKRINDEMMLDKEAWAAVDWIDNGFSSLSFGKQSYPLMKREDVLEALSKDSPDDPNFGVVLRKCLDAWFYYLVLLEHYVRGGLIEFSDIEYPVSYYIKVLRREPEMHRACLAYIEAYGVDGRAINFMHRIP